ncbi:hypothetical protein BACCAP_02233 [Pseudoflavonifractor capillosus ATCC 29799]|uniref:Uncharacterized protein n=1 Tax=Pseudoflavonifractor capillosus ATCC 29799 TaxID=411467 RepID=A6NVJ2_9FIRM|nr:hypothetical protein BACCAP_02233 [Pseudoflavonifractor capillosus ATCC 29799]
MRVLLPKTGGNPALRRVRQAGPDCAQGIHKIYCSMEVENEKCILCEFTEKYRENILPTVPAETVGPAGPH